MKILLIDADSIIPNIALMKLSTYHKSNGNDVDFTKLGISYYPQRKNHIYHVPENKYDRIYCSVIFDRSIEYVKGTHITFGGTGYSLKRKLSHKIETVEPDYSIYPENDTSYGFISRGCIRKCFFCKVPEKEGYIKQVSTPDKITRHRKVKFLDNNFLSLPNHLDILKELSDNQLRCSFSQGLDIRLLTKENSVLLFELNYIGQYIFAFDDWSYGRVIVRGLELLSWRKPWQIKFFVYCHPDMEISNIVNRVNFLRRRKCLPYIMRDIKCFSSINSDFYVDISSWCNQPSFFKKTTFKEFLEIRYAYQKNDNRTNRSYGIYLNSMKH